MEFDHIICGGQIADGSGTTKLFAADIGVNGDRIVAIGNLQSAQSQSTIDAADRSFAPALSTSISIPNWPF